MAVKRLNLEEGLTEETVKGIGRLPKVLKEFGAESAIMAELRHPNVVMFMGMLLWLLLMLLLLLYSILLPVVLSFALYAAVVVDVVVVVSVVVVVGH